MPQGLIVDRSNNNAGPVNWAEAKAAGVIAIILKASEGETFTDPTYAPQLAGATAVGLPVIAYHFAHFTNIAVEAALFKRVAGARARVLDSETNTSIVQQNAFLAALNLPSDEEMDYGSASSLPRSGIRALLWPASYGKNYGFGDCWQFSETQRVPGMPGLVDASRWIGSDADFDALFNISAPVPSQKGLSMFATDPQTGGTWSTDADGALYAENGAREVGSLTAHPAWKAGQSESGGSAPCMGLAACIDKVGQWGVVFFVQMAGRAPDGSLYHSYRFNRDGTTDGAPKNLGA